MRIGTVGSGEIVEKFIDAARQVPGVDVCAIYSRTLERAEAFSVEQNIENIYTNRKDFFASDIDFVYIANPNSLHYEWAKDALLTGKNVICEKPLTSNLAETMELVDLAKRHNLFLFEAMTTPHLPNLRLIKEKLSQIGNVKMVQTSFVKYSQRYDDLRRGVGSNVFSAEFSGGVLMDLACYNIALLAELFGMPNNLKYYANFADNGVDTSGVIVLEYDGFIATSFAGKDCHSSNYSLIQGEDGIIIVNGRTSRCESFTLSTMDGERKFNIQDNENALFYEMLEFKEVYDKSDYIRRDEFLDMAIMRMTILDMAKKSAGITFKADN